MPCIYLLNKLHVSTSFSFWVTKWSELSLWVTFWFQTRSSGVFFFFILKCSGHISYGRYVFHGLKLLISAKTKCDPFLYRLLTLGKSNKLTGVLPFFRPRTRVITSFLIYRPSSSSSYAFKNSRILHKPRFDGLFVFLILNGVECPKTLWDYSEKKSPQKRINEQIVCC